MGDDRTCPKCGAPEYCRGVSGYEVIYGCDAGVTSEGFWVDSWTCIRKVVSDLTARAEKAEAEAVRLMEAIEARDWFAQYIGHPATCTYCGRRDSTHHTDRPTVTHPADAFSPTGEKEEGNEAD